MIIDAHAHFGPALRMEHPFGPVSPIVNAEDLIKQLDQVGIDKAIVFAPRWQGGSGGEDFIDPNYEQANAAIAAGVSAYPDRLIGFARVNPKFGSQAVAELERCFTEYGFRGLKLDNETEWFSPLHTRPLAPLMERCAAQGAPVIVHTWFHPAEPLLWLTPAQTFPDVNFILAHMGYRQAADAVITAQKAPNVYLDTAAQMPMTIRNAIQAIGADRVIFGSDMPNTIPTVELQGLRSLELSEEDFANVTSQNIARLVRMDTTVPAAD